MKEMLNLLKIKTTEEKKDNINKVFASLGMVFLIVLSCLYLSKTKRLHNWVKCSVGITFVESGLRML
jgi:hypothetical protein